VGARFSAPFQAMGTGSFPGVKRPGSDVDHPPPSSTEVKERVELYLYSPFGPSWRTLPDNGYRVFSGGKAAGEWR